MGSTVLGKHWYNNGEVEKYAEECPEGWEKGRLKKIGEAASKRMKENNPMKNLSPEKLALHSQHIHEYNLNKTEEQIKHKSEAISKARKGKNIGKEPWNKGKKGVQVAWNKGKSNYMTQEQKKKMVAKQYQTKKKNNSFNISQPEESYYNYLLTLYSENDIIRQYKDDRYPFNCDFYIKSEDKFIEINLSWTHGGHPFDEFNEEDLSLLEFWKLKAENSEYYKNAIYTWTDLDVRKRKIALENNLNYEVVYEQG